MPAGHMDTIALRARLNARYECLDLYKACMALAAFDTSLELSAHHTVPQPVVIAGPVPHTIGVLAACFLDVTISSSS